MILSLEDEIRIEILNELRKKNPRLEEQKPDEFNRLYQQGQINRIDARRRIKNRYPLKAYVDKWLFKFLGEDCSLYASLSPNLQKKTDFLVYDTIKKFFCGNVRVAKEVYRVYWKHVKKYRKAND